MENEKKHRIGENAYFFVSEFEVFEKHIVYSITETATGFRTSYFDATGKATDPQNHVLTPAEYEVYGKRISKFLELNPEIDPVLLSRLAMDHHNQELERLNKEAKF